MVTQLTRERQYNKIDGISRLKGGLANKGTSIFIKEYQGMNFASRTKKSALDVSDNGRCWWVHDYILKGTFPIHAETTARVYTDRSK